MQGSITIRIYLRDFRKIKKVFPLQRGETMASYFERLAKFAEDSKLYEDLTKVK